MVFLHDPVIIVGDIHGQYYDLVKLLELGDFAQNPKQKYLFLGDFVDRGTFGVEVVTLLYALKVNYPKRVFFLRGNHECRNMTTHMNFRLEVLSKFDQETYDLLMDSFDMLPLACIVNNKLLVVHGGISPELKDVDRINLMDRFREPPRKGLFW